MIENEELGVKITENPNEAFWTETKQKCLEAIITEERNLLINKQIIELCDKQLKVVN